MKCSYDLFHDEKLLICLKKRNSADSSSSKGLLNTALPFADTTVDCNRWLCTVFGEPAFS